MRKLLAFIAVLALAAAMVPVSSAGKAGFTATTGGLRYRDIKIGSGAAAQIGRVAVIHFSGWLAHNGAKGKKIFDSRDQGKPIAFKIGTDKVIKGWNIGVIGMRVGGKRRLLVPAKLGYGAKGVEGIVPPNADLIFDIELIGLR